MQSSKCNGCKFNILNTLGVYCDCRLMGCDDSYSTNKCKTDGFDKQKSNE